MAYQPKSTNVKRTKRDAGYVTYMPRCSFCAHFVPPKTVLLNSLPRQTNPECKLLDIHVRANAFCKHFLVADKDANPPAEIMKLLTGAEYEHVIVDEASALSAVKEAQIGALKTVVEGFKTMPGMRPIFPKTVVKWIEELIIKVEKG